MSVVIERVAMAIAIKEITRRGANKETARRLILREGGPNALQYNQARAAIEAMREPTDAMVRAGDTTFSDCERWGAPRETWPLMIDAALSDAASVRARGL